MWPYRGGGNSFDTRHPKLRDLGEKSYGTRGKKVTGQGGQNFRDKGVKNFGTRGTKLRDIGDISHGTWGTKVSGQRGKKFRDFKSL